MSGPVLSIVIVNWNTRDMLRACLESVDRETFLSHDIWVVDNGSEDGSPEMIRNEFKDVHLIANTDNRGFAAANNQALPLCEGAYVLLLNSDTVVLEGALDRMVAFMHGHAEAGALGCKLLNQDGTLQLSAHSFYNAARSLVENRLIQNLWPHRHAHTPFLSFWDHSSARRVDWVTGAALMVRRQVLRAVGLLDETFFMYGEEVDWQWRMKEAGYQVFFTPSAHIIHYGGGSSRRAWSRMKRHEMESRRLFVEKHYSPLARALYQAKTQAAMGFWEGMARLRGAP